MHFNAYTYNFKLKLCNLTKYMYLICRVPIRHNFMSLFWLIFQVSGTAPSVTTQPSTIIEEGDFGIGGHPYTTLTESGGKYQQM